MTSTLMAQVRAKVANTMSGNKLSGNYFSPVEGDTIIRFLPGPAESPADFYVESLVININGKTFHSPRVIGQYCPIAFWVNNAYSTENQNEIVHAKNIKPKKRYYFNIIVRQLKDKSGKVIAENVGPKIFACGQKLFARIDACINDPQDQYPNFLDIVEGNDFRLNKRQVDGYPNYDNSNGIFKPCPLAATEGERQDIMSKLHDLRKEIVIASADELQAELDMYLDAVNLRTGGAKVSTWTPPQATPAAPGAAPTATQTAAPAPAAAATPATSVSAPTKEELEFMKMMEQS